MSSNAKIKAETYGILSATGIALAIWSSASLAAGVPVVTASGVEVGLYGLVQLDGAWENHRAGTAPGNLAYWAETGRHAQSGEWNLTANQTRLGFNLKGVDTGFYSLSGKVEFDFYGNGGSENAPVPRLRHGYGVVAFPSLGLSALAGQTSDVISPLAPPTVNAGVLYYGGDLGNRRPQLRLTEIVSLPGGVSGELAVAAVRAIGTASPYVATSTDGGHDADIPTFQGRIGVSIPSWVGDRKAILGVSGHYGQEDVLLDTAGRAPNYEALDTWSANVDLELPLTGFLSLAGEAYRGENLDGYQGGINQGFVKDGSSVKNVEAFGGWVALRLKYGAFTANLGGGVDSVHASTIGGGGKTRNTNAFGNVGYSLRGGSRIAFEIERIETDYKAGASEELWRSQAAYTYGF